MHFITGLEDISSKYQGFIVDLWGVVHDGYTPFPGVIECLHALRQSQKPILFLSNSSQRASYLSKHLAEMGISPDLYTAIHSSGEDVFEYLRDFPPQGKAFAIGSPGHFAQDPVLNLDFTLEIDESDFILSTSPGCTSATHYDEILQRGAARHIPMLCANPDLTALHGGRQVICAGSIAQRYEQLGGKVTYHGKPHLPVYQKALKKLGGFSPSQVLAIGDSLRTDIVGAQTAKIDSLLVMTGLEGLALNIADPMFLPEEKIKTHCTEKGTIPTYISFSLGEHKVI